LGRNPPSEAGLLGQAFEIVVNGGRKYGLLRLSKPHQSGFLCRF